MFIELDPVAVPSGTFSASVQVALDPGIQNAQWAKLSNLSPYGLRVTIASQRHWLEPGMVNVFPLSGARFFSFRAQQVYSGAGGAFNLLVEIATDADCFLGAYPCVVQPEAVNLALTSNLLPAQLANFDGFDPSQIGGNLGAAPTIPVQAFPFLYNPSTGKWDRPRTPTQYQTLASQAAGSIAVWTPAAGLRFRLLGYILMVTSNATMAAAGFQLLSLLDGVNPLGSGISNPGHRHSLWLPATAAPGPIGPPLYFATVALPGNGYLSTAPDNVLNLSQNTALTAGTTRLTVWGTEE